MKSPFLGSFSLRQIPAQVRASSAKSISSTLANTGDLRHLGLQLVISFPKLSDFSQAIVDSAGEIVPFGLSAAQFVFVLFPDLHSPLCQFGLETSPCVLVVVVVLLLRAGGRLLPR